MVLGRIRKVRKRAESGGEIENANGIRGEPGDDEES